MTEPFLGEIMTVSFNYAPKGWALCNGQLLSIAQNQALFSLLGTTYGGNGITTFALPDLRGRSGIHMGNGHVQGEVGGVDSVTINASQLPAHGHQMNVSSANAQKHKPTSAMNLAAPMDISGSPANGFVAGGVNGNSLHPESVGISNTGNNTPQPHENRSPFLVLNYVIALQGIFPSQT